MMLHRLIKALALAEALSNAESVCPKKCGRCKAEKSRSEFSADATKGDGLSAYCIACKRSVNIESRRKHSRARAPSARQLAQFQSNYQDRGPDECRIWQGGYLASGTPRVQWMGNPNAHPGRVACQLAGKPVPRNHIIEFECMDRRCVNPAHIFFLSRYEAARESKTIKCPAYANARKIRCIHGHPYEPWNTRYYRSRGYIGRICLMCFEASSGTKLKPQTVEEADRSATVRISKAVDQALRVTKTPKVIWRDCRDELIALMWAGKITPEDFPVAVPKAKRKAWELHPDRWARSLDEPVSDDGRPLVEYIPEAQPTDPALLYEQSQEEGEFP
jgi:hypothetical protein